MVVICICLFFANYTVEKNYFAKASLAQGHYFSRVKEAKGIPEDEVWREANESYSYKVLLYNGYEYWSESVKEPDDERDYTIANVIITDPAYKIGFWGIGIGSSRKQVERVYAFTSKIKDLNRENTIGFIDNGIWVEFTFSSDETVSRIAIYRGP